MDYTVTELELLFSTQIETVVTLSCCFPFREPTLIDQVITEKRNRRLDSILTVYETGGNYWYKDKSGDMARVFRTNYYSPRDTREPLYRELMGLVFATDREFVTSKSIMGNSIGVVPVHGFSNLIDLRDPLWKEINEHYDLSLLR